MRRINLGGQGVTMWTPPIARADTVPPPRKAISGWTPNAARRNRAFLLTVDPFGLSRDLGYAVTLTLGATPINAEIWRKIVHRFLIALRRLGVIRYHWVVEWTKKGRPHLHLTIYFQGMAPILLRDDLGMLRAGQSHIKAVRERAAGPWVPLSNIFGLREGIFFKVIGPNNQQKKVKHRIAGCDYLTDFSVANAILLAWQRAAAPIPCNPKAQHIERIEGVSGWHVYVAKHCARGVDHYQRAAMMMPPSWTSSGRLWGEGGDWPQRSEDLEIDDTSYFRLRRALRRWLRAKAAQKIATTSGRVQDAARRELRYLRRSGVRRGSNDTDGQKQKKLSSVLAFRTFAPRELVDLLLVWAIGHQDAVLIDLDTGEVFGDGAAADRAILDHVAPRRGAAPAS